MGDNLYGLQSRSSYTTISTSGTDHLHGAMGLSALTTELGESPGRIESIAFQIYPWKVLHPATNQAESRVPVHVNFPFDLPAYILQLISPSAPKKENFMITIPPSQKAYRGTRPSTAKVQHSFFKIWQYAI